MPREQLLGHDGEDTVGVSVAVDVFGIVSELLVTVEASVASGDADGIGAPATGVADDGRGVATPLDVEVPVEDDDGVGDDDATATDAADVSRDAALADGSADDALRGIVRASIDASAAAASTNTATAAVRNARRSGMGAGSRARQRGQNPDSGRDT